jgi:hypothetical protein
VLLALQGDKGIVEYLCIGGTYLDGYVYIGSSCRVLFILLLSLFFPPRLNGGNDEDLFHRPWIRQDVMDHGKIPKFMAETTINENRHINKASIYRTSFPHLGLHMHAPPSTSTHQSATTKEPKWHQAPSAGRNTPTRPGPQSSYHQAQSRNATLPTYPGHALQHHST